MLALLLLPVLLRPAGGETPPVPPTDRDVPAPRTNTDVTMEQRSAVERGLAFLKERQISDGSWGARTAPIAITAICTLAFLAGGNTERTGKYRDTVHRALQYLLKNVDVTAEGAANGKIADKNDMLSRMHGHGYATLALAQAYGELRCDVDSVEFREYRRRLEAAVRLIERSQETKTGGWGYSEFPSRTSHEGSVTVCQIQALRAARDAGIRVDGRTIERALDYVRKSQDHDGGFVYSLSNRVTSYALTAAALSTLNGIGDYDSDLYRRGLDFLHRNLDYHLRQPRYLYYANFYAAQAMWQAQDRSRNWDRYWDRVRRKLLAAEAFKGGRGTGEWPSDHFAVQDFGPEYGTGFACLILQIPYAYLPLFQR